MPPTDDRPAVTLRRAGSADGPFLAAMLREAANWNPDREPVTAEQVLTTPALAHYVEGWGRAGDLGLVAVDATGTAVAAAWLRRFDAAGPGYGYVADDVPELSIAVAPGHRGRGIGRALLTALLAAAEGSGTSRVSLSVEPDNPALALYAASGFVTVASSGGSLTMLRGPANAEPTPHRHPGD